MPTRHAAPFAVLTVHPGLHGVDDRRIARAAAQVADELVPDILPTRVRVPLGQGRRGQQHAGCTEAALSATTFEEALLKWMQLTDGIGESVEGGDLMPFCLDGVHQAGTCGSTVDEHRAGATHALVAAVPHVGEPDVVVQGVEQGAIATDP